MALLLSTPAFATNTPETARPERFASDLATPTEVLREPSRLSRNIVPFASPYEPGTILVETRGRRLLLVISSGRALQYPIAVGRQGFTWSGDFPVSRKAEWPDWRPPKEMRQRDPSLPAYMRGGPKNPLGARAIYLGETLYRIHGTNEPKTIGRAVSSGCFRMFNEDVIDLYRRTQVGTRVVVVDRLSKTGAMSAQDKPADPAATTPSAPKRGVQLRTAPAPKEPKLEALNP